MMLSGTIAALSASAFMAAANPALFVPSPVVLNTAYGASAPASLNVAPIVGNQDSLSTAVDTNVDQQDQNEKKQKE